MWLSLPVLVHIYAIWSFKKGRYDNSALENLPTGQFGTVYLPQGSASTTTFQCYWNISSERVATARVVEFGSEFFDGVDSIDVLTPATLMELKTIIRIIVAE